MDRRRFLAAAGAAAAIPSIAATTAPPPSGPTRRALVLTGGGARGAYQAGAIQGLYDRGERFDLICGTSVGAVNGALVAQGDLAELAALWSNISRLALIQPIPTVAPFLRAMGELQDPWRGVLSRPINVLRGLGDLFDHGRVFSRTGFLEPAPIASYLRSVLALERVRMPFAWSATNLTMACSEVFYLDSRAREITSSASYRFHRLDPAHDGDRAIFPETVRASTSIPLAFPPVALTPRGSTLPGDYVDGGIALNAPISVARRLGATEIVAIGVDPPRRPHRVGGLLDVVFCTLAANQTTLLFHQIEDASLPPLRAFGIVRPTEDPPVGVLDFDRQAELDAAFAQGRQDGRNGSTPVPFDDPAALERLIEGSAA